MLPISTPIAFTETGFKGSRLKSASREAAGNPELLQGVFRQTAERETSFTMPRIVWIEGGNPKGGLANVPHTIRVTYKCPFESDDDEQQGKREEGPATHEANKDREEYLLSNLSLRLAPVSPSRNQTDSFLPDNDDVPLKYSKTFIDSDTCDVSFTVAQ